MGFGSKQVNKEMELELSSFLHQRIIDTCLPLYQGEHYQHAALESMKQVEIALRDKGLAPKDRFGDRLVSWVLGNGEHIKLSIPLGENLQDKALILFKGAFAYYRNYAAHDGTNIDKTTCFRIMILASELLDLIAASARSFEGIGGIEGMIKNEIFKTEQEFKDFLCFLDGYQILEHDAERYDLDMLAKGFNKIQEEAMYALGFITYDEWESAIEPDEGIFDSTLVGEINLTDEGNRVLDVLTKRLSKK